MQYAQIMKAILYNVTTGHFVLAGISLGMCPANERCRYIVTTSNVTTSLIGGAHP